jgi:hypothetical protein
VREASILTYETVEEIDLEYTRPIIVLGPMKVRIHSPLFEYLSS